MADSVKELGRKYLLPNYKASYDLLFRISCRLYEWKEEELLMVIAKKAAGVKMMIDHLEMD